MKGEKLTMLRQRTRSALTELPPFELEPVKIKGQFGNQEIVVLYHLLQGRLQREIVSLSYKSEGTIKSHIQRLFDKSGVRQVTLLVARIHAHGGWYETDELGNESFVVPKWLASIERRADTSSPLP